MSHGHPTLEELRNCPQATASRDWQLVGVSSRPPSSRVWNLGRRPSWPLGAPGDSRRLGRRAWAARWRSEQALERASYWA